MILFKQQLKHLVPLALVLVASDALATTYWIKLKAKDKFARTHIASTGVSIEKVDGESVMVIGDEAQLQRLQKIAQVESYSSQDAEALDFPREDVKFHTYEQVKTQLEAWAHDNTDIVRVKAFGKSLEGREMYDVTISTEPDSANTKPGIVFMGGHHAREHLSVEMPMGLIRTLLERYRAGDAQTVSLVKGREIHVIPMVNPDGLEYDIDGGHYHMWRKNRRNNGDGTFGVDLNRNYGYQWGTGGSSHDTNSEVYMGPAPFSEPETIAIRDFIDGHNNLSILLTFHTFSELILYPWGHQYNGIAVAKDRAVHETMASTMAAWNNYAPQQSSELYIASGDTTDWAYGTHKIISFTFEMDPSSMFEGGFYPGQSVIDGVINKNLKPCYYLMEYADNPYRVLDTSNQYGVNLNWGH